LRQVQQQHVVPGELARHPERVEGHDDALAHLHRRARADDRDALDRLTLGQMPCELRGDDGRLVAAGGEPLQGPLGVDREAADVRLVVREGAQDAHTLLSRAAAAAPGPHGGGLAAAGAADTSVEWRLPFDRLSGPKYKRHLAGGGTGGGPEVPLRSSAYRSSLSS